MSEIEALKATAEDEARVQAKAVARTARTTREVTPSYALAVLRAAQRGELKRQ